METLNETLTVKDMMLNILAKRAKLVAHYMTDTSGLAACGAHECPDATIVDPIFWDALVKLNITVDTLNASLPDGCKKYRPRKLNTPPQEALENALNHWLKAHIRELDIPFAKRDVNTAGSFSLIVFILKRDAARLAISLRQALGLN